MIDIKMMVRSSESELLEAQNALTVALPIASPSTAFTYLRGRAYRMIKAAMVASNDLELTKSRVEDYQHEVRELKEELRNAQAAIELLTGHRLEASMPASLHNELLQSWNGEYERAKAHQRIGVEK